MRNFCTYYWSVEHGRNDRLIQRMHEYLWPPRARGGRR